MEIGDHRKKVVYKPWSGSFDLRAKPRVDTQTKSVKSSEYSYSNKGILGALGWK